MPKTSLYVLGSFLLGGTLVYFFAPEKIRIEKEKEIVTETVVEEVEVVKEVEVIKEVEVEVVQSEKRVKRKITLPNGTIIEEEIFESNSEQLSRIRREEKARANEIITRRLKEIRQKESEITEITRPKKFKLGGAYDPFRNRYAFMASADLWGPFTIGALAGPSDSFLTVGVKF